MSADPCCALCTNSQDVTKIASYKIWVCQSCWDGATGGWPQTAEPTLFQALAAQGLLIPDRNTEGLLPRDYAPPSDYAL